MNAFSLVVTLALAAVPSLGLPGSGPAPPPAPPDPEPGGWVEGGPKNPPVPLDPATAARRAEFEKRELAVAVRQVGNHPFWACKRTPAEVAGIIDRLAEAGVACVVTDDGAVRPAGWWWDAPGPGRALVRIDERNDPKLRLRRLLIALCAAEGYAGGRGK
jgi:hypothetical protein